MNCVTHFYACPCREASFEALRAEVASLKEKLRVAQCREKWGAKAAAEECGRWHEPMKRELANLKRQNREGAPCGS